MARSVGRQISELVDASGDIETGNLDNAKADWNTMLNKPDLKDSAFIDTTDASNITKGIIPMDRLGSGTANNARYLRGDGQWVDNCSNYSNCTTNQHSSNCSNCDGTLKSITQDGSGGTKWGRFQLFHQGSNEIRLIVTNAGACACNCNCACACACNC